MFIQSGAARLYTTAYGSPAAPAVLGLGGWTGSGELWAHVFGPLSARWRTLAYDHRGTGATDAPLETINFPTLVDDVFAVLDAYSIERAVLAAESSGTLVALGAALRQPSRIAGLILVGAMAYSPPVGEDHPFLTSLRTDYAAAVAGFVEDCLPEAESEHLKQWGRQILHRASPAAAAALLRLNGSVDLRPAFERVAQPALLLHGEADRIVPAAAAHRLAQALPNAQLTVLPGLGHVPMLSRPAGIAAAMAAFLDAHFPPAGLG